MRPHSAHTAPLPPPVLSVRGAGAQSQAAGTVSARSWGGAPLPEVDGSGGPRLWFTLNPRKSPKLEKCSIRHRSLSADRRRRRSERGGRAGGPPPPSPPPPGPTRDAACAPAPARPGSSLRGPGRTSPPCACRRGLGSRRGGTAPPWEPLRPAGGGGALCAVASAANPPLAVRGDVELRKPGSSTARLRGLQCVS